MDPKLEQAVQAIKSGNKSAGLVLLAQVLRSDPGNEIAWIWMATAQDDPEKKKQSLERVLRINPANEAVRRALATMFPPAAPPVVPPPAVEAAPAPAVEMPPAAPEQPAGMEPPPLPQEPAAEALPAQTEPVAEAPVAEPEPASPTLETARPVFQEAEAAPQEIPPAAPDLSWLKEAGPSPEEPKEEAPDLTWLKEDLQGEPTEAAAQAEPSEAAWLEEGQPPAQAEPAKEELAPDLTWLMEEEHPAEEEPGFTWPTETDKDISSLSWMKEETPPSGAASAETAIPPAPTGETNDLAWLRAATAGPAVEPAAEQKPASEEPDFSWLAAEPAKEETPAAEPSTEPAFPWLETAAPAEEAAVKNEVEAIPDWLRQGTEAETKSAASAPAQAETPAQEPPTLETEHLSPEDIEAIAAKPAELPFTWDEVTGAPVMKPTGETASEIFAPQPAEEAVQAPAVGPAEVSTTAAGPSAPISRPRPAVPAAAVKAAVEAASPEKKGMSRGQIVLLIMLGVATLIVLLAFGFYLAVNFGWLKAFGF